MMGRDVAVESAVQLSGFRDLSAGRRRLFCFFDSLWLALASLVPRDFVGYLQHCTVGPGWRYGTSGRRDVLDVGPRPSGQSGHGQPISALSVTTYKLSKFVRFIFVAVACMLSQTFLEGQTTKVGRLALADDKGGSPGKVGRPL